MEIKRLWPGGVHITAVRPRVFADINMRMRSFFFQRAFSEEPSDLTVLFSQPLHQQV